jgi:hypothetical protein
MATRRDFLFGTGMIAIQGARLAALQVGRPAPVSSGAKIRLGIVGGGFGSAFFFHQHPNCVVTAVSDLRADRRKRLRDVYGCDNTYDSLEDMLRKEKRLDAVAIFTPAVAHYNHAEGCTCSPRCPPASAWRKRSG